MSKATEQPAVTVVARKSVRLLGAMRRPGEALDLAAWRALPLSKRQELTAMRMVEEVVCPS